MATPISMIKTILSKVFGYRLHLVLGDTLVLDRYRWLLKHLPETREGLKLLDIGCGSGAFTLSSAARGYFSVGLSWDERNQQEAYKSANETGLTDKTTFDVSDIRELNKHEEYSGIFDVCINFENMEHVLNDKKLMEDIFDILKPGGMLLFTSPYYFYKPMAQNDKGPFSEEEDGGHVRRGYTKSMLVELCEVSGFQIEEISGCSGYLSQKITRIYRIFFKISPLLAWLVIIPLRILPILFDALIKRMFMTVDYSICMVAVKPRFTKNS